jgi:hypothetical protein
MFPDIRRPCAPLTVGTEFNGIAPPAISKDSLRPLRVGEGREDQRCYERPPTPSEDY